MHKQITLLIKKSDRPERPSLLARNVFTMSLIMSASCCSRFNYLCSSDSDGDVKRRSTFQPPNFVRVPQLISNKVVAAACWCQNNNNNNNHPLSGEEQEDVVVNNKNNNSFIKHDGSITIHAGITHCILFLIIVNYCNLFTENIYAS